MCVSAIAKCILIVFNIIWVLIGLVFLGVGIAVAVLGTSYINEALSYIPGGAASVDFDISTFLHSVYIPLIVIGSVFFILGFLGCCGACCNSTCMLLVYAIIVGILLLVQVVGVIIVFVKRTDYQALAGNELKTSLIQDRFVSYNSTDAASLLVNFAQTQFKCCGIYSHKDYDKAKKWKRQLKWEGSVVTLKIPVTCCKFPEGKPFKPDIRPVDKNCPTNPTTSNSNQDTGCWVRLIKLIDDNQWWVILIICGVLLLQLVFFILAVCLRKSIDSDKVSAM